MVGAVFCFSVKFVNPTKQYQGIGRDKQAGIRGIKNGGAGLIIRCLFSPKLTKHQFRII